MVALLPISLLFSLGVSFAGTFAKFKVGLFGFSVSDDYGLFNGNGTGKAFAVFNILLTIFGVVGVMLMQFYLKVNRAEWWLAIRVTMYLSLWCALFTFYTLQVPGAKTSLGAAGGAQVFNVLLLIGINVLLFLTSDGTKTDDDDNDDDDDDDNDIEKQSNKPESQKIESETHLADGTIERKVEVTNPDGSKTITKTIEKPQDEGTEEAGNPWDEGGGEGEEEGDFVNAPEESSSSSSDDGDDDSGGSSSSSPEAPPEAPPE